MQKACKYKILVLYLCIPNRETFKHKKLTTMNYSKTTVKAEKDGFTTNVIIETAAQIKSLKRKAKKGYKLTLIVEGLFGSNVRDFLNSLQPKKSVEKKVKVHIVWKKEINEMREETITFNSDFSKAKFEYLDLHKPTFQKIKEDCWGEFLYIPCVVLDEYGYSKEVKAKCYLMSSYC